MLYDPGCALRTSACNESIATTLGGPMGYNNQLTNQHRASPPSLEAHQSNLAIGIGIQNFPEGLAVSLPLRGAGFSTWRAFWVKLMLEVNVGLLEENYECGYGQLSGMVEPLAGVFGAFAVVLAEPVLPYALAFAAGAMVYVVMDDIIPEAQISGNGKLASWASILGFVVMMSLDVGLG
ncbi:solute carrier family 39 (metal ion transporter) member 11 [Cricetulus griseus]